MTQPFNHVRHDLSVPDDNREIDRNVVFSLQWLTALDPITFTPVTWEHGRETTIRLRAGDGSTKVNVGRIVSHYVDGEIELRDEAYSIHDTEAGNQNVTPFKFTFNNEEQLVDYDRSTTLNESATEIVAKISGLVFIAGSTIQATNYRTGPESRFVSNGSVWLARQGGLIVPTLPEMGPLPLDSPAKE